MFSCHNLYLFHTLTDRLVLLFANIDLKKKEYFITSHVATYLFSHVCVCVHTLVHRLVHVPHINFYHDTSTSIKMTY